MELGVELEVELTIKNDHLSSTFALSSESKSPRANRPCTVSPKNLLCMGGFLSSTAAV